MKRTLTFIVVFAVFMTLFVNIPKSQAPVLKKNPAIEASILSPPQAPVSTFTPIISLTPEKDTLLSLLEMTVDKNHDLTAGAKILDNTVPTATNQKILQLYEAKIASRALDFEKAQELLQTVDTPEMALLKAAVLIASNDRDKAGAYLHALAENDPSGMVKSQALALLNVYYRSDRHRDADESYLWTLFAQKLGEWGELEISKYLAEKAIARSQNYRDAWIIKGYNELGLKKPDDAEFSLLTAYRLDPGNPHIQYLLGLTYYDLGETTQSNQFLLYAKDNGESYHDVIHEKLAENAIITEEFPLAAHYYETLLDASPKNERALTRLIWLYLEKFHEVDKALTTAEKLVRYFPDNQNHLELLKAIREAKEATVQKSVG